VTRDAVLTSGRPLPTGTVTFLRTDIEGSMRLVRELGPSWDAVNADHMGLIRTFVEEHGGTLVRTEGDATFAVFPEARAAVAAAIDAQRAIEARPSPDGAPIRVRMGLHTGEAYLAGDDYGGFEVNRAARIAGAGHGGQILLSDSTRSLVVDALPPGVGVRDLGSHALRDVPAPERLYQLYVPELRSEFPPLRTETPGLGELPSRLTSFIGREADVAAVVALLGANRLVTITGPGGIGKTSLAVETARVAADDFGDGAWFVPLADVEDAATVRSVMARALGLFDAPGRSAAEALGPYLKDRSVLLVLDNFEHLLDSAGDIAHVLEASPRSRVMVTSRAPLRIPGEQEYPLDPLGDAGVRLFVERARAVRPGWEPGADGAIIDEVCNLVDRLPLGLELAAARVAHIPLAAIRDRLAGHLPLPGAGPRNVPDRQRTLEGAISWSHDLLPAGSRRVLHDLAVFEGSFDLDQAQAVVETTDDVGDVLDELVELVDQSLVQRDAPDASGYGVRFRLLETIRAFALDRLRAEGREEAALRRHALAYLALAEEGARHLPGPDQPRWLDRLTIDYPNLRAALRWTMDTGDVELALRFIAGLWRFWQLDGRLDEGTELAESALRLPGAGTPTRARMAAVTAAGGIAYWHGRPDAATTYYIEQLRLAQELRDVAAEADAAWNLSFEKYIDDDLPAAEELFERARQLYEEIGDEQGVARATWSAITVQSGDHPNPGDLQELLTLLRRFERLGDVWYAGQTMMSIAWVSYAGDDLAGASRWFTRSLTMAHSLRDRTSTTIALPLAALLAVIADRHEAAAELLGAHEQFQELYGVKAPLGLEQLLDAQDPHVLARATLGDDAYEAAFARGKQMTLDQAVALTVKIQAETWGPG
jgi:predicted ATPase/class 3 adenylate cyclase